MWTNKNISSLQKTYDESYLKCSTAVYYEGQGDEKEAMLCWRNALDQIRLNPANRRQSSYSPKSETERALLESLRELEVQCKERIDLLEALRLSREDDRTLEGSSSRPGLKEGPEGRSYSNTPEKGWIGDGTIPAITYPELSKPPLPKRPSFPSRSSSELAVVGGHGTTSDYVPSSSAARLPSLPPYGVTAGMSGVKQKTTRSPSPDKRTMRTTLRSGRFEKPSKSQLPRSTPTTRISKGPGASKAATLAWSNLGSKESVEKALAVDTSGPSSKLPESRHSYEQLRKGSALQQGRWDSHTRRLIISPETPPVGTPDACSDPESPMRTSMDYMGNGPSPLALGAASSALNSLSIQGKREPSPAGKRPSIPMSARRAGSTQDEPGSTRVPGSGPSNSGAFRRKPIERSRTPEPNSAKKRVGRDHERKSESKSASSDEEHQKSSSRRRKLKGKQKESPVPADAEVQSSEDSKDEEISKSKSEWEKKKRTILNNLPPGVDDAAAKAIFNEIVVQGDEVRWSDVAGLEIAKNALREAVVYPFLRPDLFMGLREPARGMLLFGPPGTGKTMLARAVATESRSTFFSISASSLTSKYLGESEKLVRALFGLAKVMAPSIIFVDEIDSLLSQRSGSGEHEATRRIKTEFLIQWSDLQRAAAGRESPGGPGDKGDANRVLVLAATNLPWAIDEAARRRFVRRQYIPLPEAPTRATQLNTLLGQQKHNLTDSDIAELVGLTEGFSGSDITALAKDAAMGPLRSLGEALLHMTMDQIRPIELCDFKSSLQTIRPSVSKDGLKEYEDWARQFGERGG
ncbi:Uu.00g138060.m01.CDS01 [Anthostomella pinea]|uniref:Uu.00g138060.m01.CDS01 n=1 Tax=Anthostomella pinea TaxID=933095 RepID=A0AAI8YLA4_9PEZI|nr:Uu.00g138060.m01.CDS01 [Anthostomella pinea]